LSVFLCNTFALLIKYGFFCSRFYKVVVKRSMFIKRVKIFIVLILVGIQMMSAQEISLPGDAPAAGSVRESAEEVRHWYLKTNTIGWGLLIANLAGEMDWGKHWSFVLPVYYSACNYFTSEVKFRTLTLQPELRYWFRNNHTGWYTGAHLGASWFNLAAGGDYRYQDHNRCTPALGGGLNGGYRMPMSKNGRWWLEFSLGAGVYQVDYDKFQNRKNGSWIANEKKVTFAVDQVAVSVVYRFDKKKKEK
jgi:hypothetical protein